MVERGEWEIWGQTGPVMLCSGNQSQLAVLQGLKNVFLNEKTSLGMSKNVKSKHTTSANWPNQNLEKDALCFPLAETELGAIRSGSRVQTPPDAPRCLGEALNFHRVSRPLCLQNIIPSCLFGRLQGLHPRWKAGPARLVRFLQLLSLRLCAGDRACPQKGFSKEPQLQHGGTPRQRGLKDTWRQGARVQAPRRAERLR